MKFRYFDENGEIEETSVMVEENKKIPYFHTHDTIAVGDGSNRMVFRYWKLASGNLSSSLTVMSDCVFEAIYDEIQEPFGG